MADKFFEIFDKAYDYIQIAKLALRGQNSEDDVAISNLLDDAQDLFWDLKEEHQKARKIILDYANTVDPCSYSKQLDTAKEFMGDSLVIEVDE